METHGLLALVMEICLDQMQKLISLSEILNVQNLPVIFLIVILNSMILMNTLKIFKILLELFVLMMVSRVFFLFWKIYNQISKYIFLLKAILRTNGAFLLNGSSYFEGNAIMIGQDGYAGPICGPWYITEVNIYKSQYSYKPMLYIIHINFIW